MIQFFVRLFSVSLFTAFLIVVQAQPVYFHNAQVTSARLLGATGPLIEKPPISPIDISKKKKAWKSHYQNSPPNFLEATPFKNHYPDALPKYNDRISGTQQFLNMVIPVDPILNFDGINVTEAANIGVPDANGDVSPNHYIQITNGGGSVFKIFDKAGTLLLGPLSLNTLWQDLNVTGLGDPIVLWDQSAERWLIAELGAAGTNVLLVAVSETSDPLDNWNAYEFQAPNLPDYPKIGIWPNGYYITTDEVNDANIPIYVLDRTAMLAGASTVDVQRLGIPKFTANNSSAFQTATPVDWDGAISPPPNGSPHIVMRMYDDAWDGGQDKLEIWEVDIDWINPNNSSVLGPIELFTEPFDSDLCNGSIFDCLEQANGETVSAMMQVLMHRVNYRNFGTHESIVLNHVVDINGNNQAGVRWYELRKPAGGDWSIYQQGTVAPDEENHRFMGSIAMDAGGNIGLAYSIMGPDKLLSLAFTGRRSDDPLGEMTVIENEFAEGLSLHEGFRWGDYTMMTVDEADGNTFWFTGEYMKADALWGTKIISFRIERDSMDIGPLSLLAPQTSAYLTDNESIQTTIFNYGLNSQTGFKVGVVLDDQLLVQETITENLEPDSSITITFNMAADLSEIRDYSFKIFTSLDEDGNVFNDTLRATISKLPRYDAGVIGFRGIQNTICDSFTTVGIVIANFGAEPLNNMEVQYELDGGPTNFLNWSGGLNEGQSDTISVLLTDLSDALHTLTARTYLPNNEADEDITNDQLERNFEVLAEGIHVELMLRTDEFAQETSWELRDTDGALLFEGGNYFEDSTVFYIPWCLEEGCYSFTIFDNFGDGFDSPGTYVIRDENDKILATLLELNFGDSETSEFCLPFTCTLEGDIFTVIESQMGAHDGVINIEASNGIQPFQYSINGGLTFQEEPLFSGLPGGMYQIVVVDANACTYEVDLFLETCAIQVSVLATNATQGQTNGSIEISASNGIPPFQYSIDAGMTFQDSNLFINLAAGTYNVLVTDSLGCITSLDAEIQVTTSSATLTYGKTVQILPNPTHGIFRINVNGIPDRTVPVALLDGTGKVLLRNRLVRYDETLTGMLSLLKYPAGVYYIKLDHPELTQLHPVVRY